MAQQIEIEFKNMLKENEFLTLKNHFQFEENDFKEQINHYFDTPDFAIKEKHAALRIREKGETRILTLKEPAEIGLLETEQLLTIQEANQLKENGLIPEGPVKEQLIGRSISLEKLEYFGSLTTIRAEKNFQNGLIVLDHSRYLEVEDYELEYEVTDEATGKIIFEKLLERFHIPIRETKNKVRRFYERLYS
ncbi:CYTH domain-containing protein [Metabacillus sp. RGM 3146]|uniref:CYTH domain-containing protein n=1 Tax=Metabacillus sp. RGM 3146 TaxID=3401092 RepID=UPI003B9A97BA